MTTINLLPWRNWLLVRRVKTSLGYLCLSLVVVVVLLVSWQIKVAGDLSRQRQAAVNLQQKLAQVTPRYQKLKEQQKLKIELTQDLDRYKKLEWAHVRVLALLLKLGSRIPSSVFLQKVTGDGEQVTLQGTALSEAALALFMQRLAQGDFSLSVKLLSEERKENGTGNAELMSFVIVMNT